MCVCVCVCVCECVLSVCMEFQLGGDLVHKYNVISTVYCTSISFFNTSSRSLVSTALLRSSISLSLTDSCL